MTLDPRFARFAKISGLDQWFNQEGLLRIQQAFLAAMFAQRCGATFRNPPLGKEKK